jgi:hypothetical protein
MLVDCPASLDSPRNPRPRRRTQSTIAWRQGVLRLRNFADSAAGFFSRLFIRVERHKFILEIQTCKRGTNTMWHVLSQPLVLFFRVYRRTRLSPVWFLTSHVAVLHESKERNRPLTLLCIPGVTNKAWDAIEAFNAFV